MLLAQARRRVLAQRFFSELGAWVLVAGGVLLLILAGQRWAQLPALPFAIVAGAAAGVALLVALLRTVLGLPGEAELAARLDRLGHTHDRLTTALAFDQQPPTPMHAMAQRECAAFLAGKDFRPLLPWQMPAAWRWLAVPVFAIALLQWDLSLLERIRAQKLAAAQEQTSPTVEALRALARQLEANAKKTDDPALKKLAAEVARRADELHATKDPGEARKAALRELSALEQMAQDMKRPPAKPLTPEEQKALAEALQKAEATRKAAEKLSAGDRNGAAEELDRTAQKAETAGENSEAAKAEAALREALQRLAEQNALSPNAQQQLSAGAQSALRRLAEALRKMPQGQGSKSGQPNSQSSQESLENLLSALQNLKFGEGQPGTPGQESKGGGQPQIVQISPAPSENSAGPQTPIPSGQPGSEHDQGTTKDPFGEKQESAKQGADLAVRGEQTGKGETYSQALPGGLDASRSTRQYKQLYDTLAPAAENAVLQEDIPLGSRLFIKRYFESIRPTQ
jgi:hypothetical protein